MPNCNVAELDIVIPNSRYQFMPFGNGFRETIEKICDCFLIHAAVAHGLLEVFALYPFLFTVEM